ncbi:MAG: glycosyltransferase [Provencibacterium sp.]|jgi:glycosyltransferase involved in cell wall biosynthesis|nr:glycosyltransferase [Provencibacterium sp.]
MKKLLFVINTLGRAGAETALLELLERLKDCGCEIHLYVLLGQGSLIRQLPSHVRLLNDRFDECLIFTREGRYLLAKKVLKAFFRHGHLLDKTLYLIRTLWQMAKARRIQLDKLFWRVVAQGAEYFDTEYDLAVAAIEGGSAYYVADYVKARRKIAFIHIDYKNAGYTKGMDQDCFSAFDAIFAVSEETRSSFLGIYPEHAEKTRVFDNILNREKILRRAQETDAFRDDFEGIRLLTVGRLVWQKAYDVAAEVMKLLQQRGCAVRWYILGEGEERGNLEKQIKGLGLEKDFLLLGHADNPYPYYLQTDIYVHMTRFEGKSIAVQEAMILGCAVIVSDCNGNREQVENGQTGLLCPLDPEKIAESIEALCEDKEKRERLGRAAAEEMGRRELEFSPWFLLMGEEAPELSKEQVG